VKDEINLIYEELYALNLPARAWALIAKLNNLNLMHPDHIAAEHKRAKDRERKRVSVESVETPIVILNNNIPGGDRGVGKGEPISAESVGFDAAWKLYPCKQSKGRARKAYAAKRKAGVSQDEIIAGIGRLVAEKREPKFWPYFATWLNEEGWLNEGAKVVSFRPAVAPQRTWAEIKAEREGSAP
jgi:hypothetical protein